MLFMPLPTKDNVLLLIYWWIGVFLFLSVMQWRSKRAVGLPLAYVLMMSLIHPIGAIPYCMDYYMPRSQMLLDANVTLGTTITGLYVALVGLISLVLGVVIRPFVFARKSVVVTLEFAPQISTKLPMTLLLMSIVFFLVIGPVIKKIPSIGQLGQSGTMLSVVAIYLLSLMAMRRGDVKRQWGWLMTTPMFPLVTMLFMGFSSYGGAAAGTVWALAYRVIKPRLVAILAIAMMLYFGMTFYTNYMRERSSIRGSVWGGGGFAERMEKLQDIYRNFESFSVHNQTQMEMIDGRLNQSDLVGKAVRYIEAGNVDFARGGTLYVAAIAWIPRILWPGKPNIGGSGSLVSKYTGMTFATSTSVGVGQVLEFYINWGLVSVVFGFFAYGMLLQYIDQRAAEGLESGDIWGGVRWLLPGLSLLQAGGSLAETIGSLAATGVFIWLMHKFIFEKYYDRSNLTSSRRAMPGDTPRGSRYPQSMRP